MLCAAGAGKECGEGEVNLFTRPRHFGKSLNMSMLKSFFEIGSDPSVFDGLKIRWEKGLCKKKYRKFSMLSISLKSVDGRNFKAAADALRRIIGNEACSFSFLSESNYLGRDDKELYNGLTAIKDGSFIMEDDILSDNLKTLSRLLSRYYGQRAILLGNALKINASLYFAVLTGCLRISKESIFTGLNNLKVHTVSDVQYDGYRFGDTDVYCPWDVINYCDELLAAPSAPPKNYWANTSGNDLILGMLKNADQTTKDEVEELLNGGQVTKRIKQELTYRDIDESIENVWSVLYATCYLTGTHVEQADADIFRLWIPNGEIRKLFYELVEDWFRETTRSDTARINRFCAAFPKGDIATIQDMLCDYLWESISVRDTAVRRNMKETSITVCCLGFCGARTAGW